MVLIQFEGDSDVQKSVVAKVVSLSVNEGHREKFCKGVPIPAYKPYCNTPESCTGLLEMST